MTSILLHIYRNHNANAVFRIVDKYRLHSVCNLHLLKASVHLLVSCDGCSDIVFTQKLQLSLILKSIAETHETFHLVHPGKKKTLYYQN